MRTSSIGPARRVPEPQFARDATRGLRVKPQPPRDTAKQVIWALATTATAGAARFAGRHRSKGLHDHDGLRACRDRLLALVRKAIEVLVLTGEVV